MSRKPETVFKQALQGELRNIPKSIWFKTEAGALHGLPDIMGCVSGFFIALEIKRSRSAVKKSKQYKLQKYYLDCIRACGGFGEFVYPENVQEILLAIKNLGKRKRLH